MQEIMSKWINVKGVIRYIMDRQNSDGGYTFCQGTDSSAEDTYYAIEILKALNVEPKFKERTIQFLKGLQNSDGSFDSVKVAYYVTKALINLGSKPKKDPNQYIMSLQNSYGGFGSIEVDVEASSEIETTYLSIEILKLLNNPIESKEKIIKFILSLKNSDGSFGGRGYSKLASTWHALATLKLLGYNVFHLHETLKWIKGCEASNGGFVRNPNSLDNYILIDSIYYGVKSLEIFNEACKYPFQTVSLISKFQNRNGGFRKSIFLGISTFEDTYYAVFSLQTILKWMNKSE
jgi:hypothetical protein